MSLTQPQNLSIGPQFYGVGLFAGKPSSPPVGFQYVSTDLGGGTIFEWTGTYWKPVNGIAVVRQNNTLVTSSDTSPSTANALDSFVLPGGVMGANGALRITVTMKGADAISAAKNTRIWANSTQIFAVATTTTNGIVQYQFIWTNEASESAQTAYYNQSTVYGTTSGSVGNSGINTASDVTIYLTADSASASGPTMSKYAYMVELLRA